MNYLIAGLIAALGVGLVLAGANGSGGSLLTAITGSTPSGGPSTATGGQGAQGGTTGALPNALPGTNPANPSAAAPGLQGALPGAPSTSFAF